MTSIFVAKLDFGVTQEQLKQAFEKYGTVLKATVALDRETGKSRGFGFVEMQNRDQALSAIENLNGSSLNGRQITVKEADQKPEQRGPRPQFTPRDNSNNSRRDNSNFIPRSQGPKTEEKEKSDDYRSKADGFEPPILAPQKNEGRKKVDKEKDKKGKTWADQDGKTKKPKMNAYKKSGKNSKYLDDDLEDDFDIHNFSDYEDTEEYDEDEFFDEDNDRDEFYDDDNEELDD